MFGQTTSVAGKGERVIVNPLSGEQIVIRTSAAQSDGRLLAFDLFLPPGGHVPARHTHPNQTEKFTVLAGRMRFSLPRQTIVAGPGESVSVPAGTPHWFGNAGAESVHACVEVRPALRMQELLEASGAMGTAGTFLGLHVPRPADLARFLLDFQREIAVPGVPPALVKRVLGVYVWLERQLAPAR